MLGFDVTFVNFMRLIVFVTICIAFMNTVEMIFISLYGIDIREYMLFINPLAIDDVEFRVIL